MSLDLYNRETLERLSEFRPVTDAEPGAFDGTGSLAMENIAKGGRSISMAWGGMVKAAGEVVDVLSDVGRMTSLGQDTYQFDSSRRFRKAPPALPDITEGSKERVLDVYFQMHEDVFQGAVDYWTPPPTEVGKAAQVVGPLLGMIPKVIASPALAVADTQMSVGEDLTRQGVDPTKAQQVGAVQAAGLGLGIWMPILGANGWQRVVVGGAGFNLVQGAAMRGVSGEILEGTPAEGAYEAFDGTALTLDALLGLVFGGIAHLSPAQRAQGQKAWERLGEWASSLKPSQVEALQTLRQSQHLNVDSVGGTPKGIQDIQAHTTRLRTAIEQLVRDEPVEVSDLPAPRIEPDGRFEEAALRAEQLRQDAERVVAEEGIRVVADGSTGKPLLTEPPPRGALSATEPVGPEVIAKPVSEMTPEELRVELLRDPLTGIKNRRAFQEVESSLPIRGSVDADGLKWVNDNLGHDAGDNMLRAIGRALGEETDSAFRIGGDEFAIGAKTHDEALAVMERANSRLQDVVIKAELPDGTPVELKGVKFSYGIGKTAKEAEFRLQAHKAERERTGVRPARGSEPRGLTRRASPRQPDTERRTPTKEVSLVASEAQRIADANPDLTITVGQTAAGEPIVRTIRQFIDDAKAETAKARDDANLFKVAASCMFGVF